jgi:hypothetical protein
MTRTQIDTSLRPPGKDRFALFEKPFFQSINAMAGADPT